MVSSEKRRKRRVIRLMQREAVWLQKAFFALQKAEEVRDKIADVNEVEPEEYTLTVKKKKMPVQAIEDALQEHSQELLETVRTRREKLR